MTKNETINTTCWLSVLAVLDYVGLLKHLVAGVSVAVICRSLLGKARTVVRRSNGSAGQR